MVRTHTRRVMGVAAAIALAASLIVQAPAHALTAKKTTSNGVNTCTVTYSDAERKEYDDTLTKFATVFTDWLIRNGSSFGVSVDSSRRSYLIATIRNGFSDVSVTSEDYTNAQVRNTVMKDMLPLYSDDKTYEELLDAMKNQMTNDGTAVPAQLVEIFQNMPSKLGISKATAAATVAIFGQNAMSITGSTLTNQQRFEILNSLTSVEANATAEMLLMGWQLAYQIVDKCSSALGTNNDDVKATAASAITALGGTPRTTSEDRKSGSSFLGSSLSS
ncbi:MAG: hypothetical protein Q3962_02685 [Corynebacterium sp.]|nr:hypothetical protein [Corynebacterium sp.]